TEGTAVITAPQAGTLDAERSWLEQRFAEVAARLEQSLAGLKSAASLDAINDRFTSLENKLGEALSRTEGGADLASLKSIESQVEDLSAQLVSAQTHFGRLDIIELELRNLAERMTSEKFVKLIEQGAAKVPDNEALAGMIANRVAQQLPRIE